MLECFHLRAFTLVAPSAWNVLPPGMLLPHFILISTSVLPCRFLQEALHEHQLKHSPWLVSFRTSIRLPPHMEHSLGYAFVCFLTGFLSFSPNCKFPEGRNLACFGHTSIANT